MKLEKLYVYRISTTPYEGYRNHDFGSLSKEDLYDQCQSFVRFKENRGEKIRKDFLDDCKKLIEEVKAVEEINIQEYASEFEDSQYSKDGFQFNKIRLEAFIKSEKEILTKSLEQLKILEEELKTME